FIPKLVFELYQTENIENDSLGCLERILNHLKINYPASLELQMKIPVNEGENSLDYIKNACSRVPNQSDLEQLLIRFGSREKEVFSNNQLKVNYNIGRGFTLYDVSTFK